MYAIIYISSAVPLMTKDDLLDLLTKSREFNASQGITGMLLYSEGSIMQLLEGDRKAVQELYDKITRDPRHRGVIPLLEAETTERQCSQWTMGFRGLTSAEGAATPGFTEFLTTRLPGKEFSVAPTDFHRLLLTFKQTM